MSENPILMTQAQYARHRNKSPQYIGKLAKAGCAGDARAHGGRRRVRRLEFETRQGKLIETAIVKERWTAILVILKERLLAVPDKLAPEVAVFTDERQVRDALKREMHALLKAIHSDIQYTR